MIVLRTNLAVFLFVVVAGITLSANAGFKEIPESDKEAHAAYDGRDEFEPKLLLSPRLYNAGIYGEHGLVNLEAICSKGGKISLVTVVGWNSGMPFETANDFKRALLLGHPYFSERPSMPVGVSDVAKLADVAPVLDDTTNIQIVRSYYGDKVENGFRIHFVFNTNIVEFKKLLETSFSLWVETPDSGYKFDPPVKAIFDSMVPLLKGQNSSRSNQFVEACKNLI